MFEKLGLIGVLDFVFFDFVFLGFDVSCDFVMVWRNFLFIFIVVVLMVYDNDLIDIVMDNGVNGFILKIVCLDDMFVVFLVVMDGEIVILRVVGLVGNVNVVEDVFMMFILC